MGPEVARRLGRLAAEPDDGFALLPTGAVLWRGEMAGQLTGGGPFSPRVRLLGQLGPAATRERAARRLEAFVAAEASRQLAALRRLKTAVAEGRVKGLARGIAYQLVENGGVLERKCVQAEARALSQDERRVLKSLGVRFGAFSLFLPALLRPEALAVRLAFADLAAPDWRPPSDRLSPLPTPAPSPVALAYRGLRAIAGLAVPLDALEQLDALIRAAPQADGGAAMGAEAFAALGWNEEEAQRILRGLGFTPARKAKAGEALIWRRRRDKPAQVVPASPASPFAALATLTSPPAVARRPRRRKTHPKRAAPTV